MLFGESHAVLDNEFGRGCWTVNILESNRSKSGSGRLTLASTLKAAPGQLLRNRCAILSFIKQFVALYMY